MKQYILVSLSVTGGILSGLAWSSWCTGLILLISFIPFFLIENHLYENHGKFSLNACFIYILPGIVIFNILSLGWVRVASIVAAITIILGLSFIMSFTIWLAHIVRIKAGNLTGFIAIISFWLAFEYLSLNTPLISPWVNLGNGLAKDIMFIQWFDLTGVGGGTLWILLSNIFLTLFLLSSSGNKKKKRFLLYFWISLIIIPAAISLTRYYTIREAKKGINEIVIVQPDIDPYTEKYSVPFEDQLSKTLNMAERAVSSKTAWLITPETTVDDPVNEDSLSLNKYIISLKKFAGEHPGISIVTGMVSFRSYSGLLEAPSRSARKIDLSGNYYDHFNSAFQVDTGKVIHIYHKSKLVSGIEMEISAGFGKLMDRILPDFGGTKWGYGVQKARDCFEHPVTKQVVAPIICYESVFGNYVADYVRKGAEALFIITNDGWWKGTNGYYQHLSYASIRAIETRRPVARAANTGISCIIDIRGRRIKETAWWTDAILTGEIGSETILTPYVHYGDYLMRISLLLSILILLYVFIALPIRKKI